MSTTDQSNLSNCTEKRTCLVDQVQYSLRLLYCFRSNVLFFLLQCDAASAMLGDEDEQLEKDQGDFYGEAFWVGELEADQFLRPSVLMTWEDNSGYGTAGIDSEEEEEAVLAAAWQHHHQTCCAGLD